MSPFDEAQSILGELVEVDVSLAPLTTYRVGGAARLFVRANSVEDLERVAAAHRMTGIEVLVIGRGSNMLVADSGYAGIAVQLGDFAATVDIPEPPFGDADLTVAAGAATTLPILSRRCSAAGLTGLEWAVGVPGSVGGAVRMNAGGHGSDIEGSLIDVAVFDLRASAVVTKAAPDLRLEFRSSGLEPHEIVLSARFRVIAGDRDQSERELGEIVRWRRENQPGGQNAGSVFVNPEPGRLAAAQVIDELGMRGLRMGSAEVSSKHANFIQASPDGTAADVWALIQHVRDEVFAARNIWLRSEIRLVGFPEEAA